MQSGLRQKFLMLAVLTGALVTIVSIIGYYTAHKNLSETLESELSAVVDSQAKDLDSWLTAKAISAEYLGNLLGNLGDINRMKNRELLSLTTSDPKILDVTIGLQDKYLFGYNAGDYTGKIDPTIRPWYNDTRDKDHFVFTAPYVDGFTNQLIVSAVAPIKINGQHVGATCVDVTLDVLNEQVKQLKYRGAGDGIIIATDGTVLANSTDRKADNVKDIPGIGDHFSEMMTSGAGYFELPSDEKFDDRVFAYTTIASTGWIMGIAVDEGLVFGALQTLQITYLILVVGGLALMIFLCMRLAISIVGPISQLRKEASELARGNLRVESIRVESDDEIGALSIAFNAMGTSLRSLIGKMSNTSMEVTAAVETLSTEANQSAASATEVAEHVEEVSANMSKQLADLDAAKQNMDTVFGDIGKMDEKTKLIEQTSDETSAAAERGEKLMGVAVEKMSNIEKSVLSSADVVQKLGESSQQIGQIIEAIAAISDQTNLLALNAAIEAARAGEHGRGFAVVADEVRKLAEQSQTSAEQIRERITIIQQDTALAVDAMKDGRKDVEAGTAAIREVGEQFEKIISSVDGIKQQMAGIGSSMRTVSDGASKIVEALNDIDEVSRLSSEYTKKIADAAQTQSASNEEIAASSKSLSGLIAEMQSEIDRFRV